MWRCGFIRVKLWLKLKSVLVLAGLLLLIKFMWSIVDFIYPGFWMVPPGLFYQFFFFFSGGGWGASGLPLLIKLMWSIVDVNYPGLLMGGLYWELSIKARFMCLKTKMSCLTSCNCFEITYYGWSWMVLWFCVLVLAGMFGGVVVRVLASNLWGRRFECRAGRFMLESCWKKPK